MSHFWTDEINTKFCALFQAGVSYAEIGRVLGTTRSAVAGRVKRLGWHRAESGGRTAEKAAPEDAAKGESSAVLPAAPRAKRQAPRAKHQATGAPVTMADVQDGECRWPIGTPGQPGFHLCGRKVKPGSPYCPYHHRKAHHKPVRDPQAAAYHAYLIGNKGAPSCQK